MNNQTVPFHQGDGVVQGDLVDIAGKLVMFLVSQSVTGSDQNFSCKGLFLFVPVLPYSVICWLRMESSEVERENHNPLRATSCYSALPCGVLYLWKQGTGLVPSQHACECRGDVARRGPPLGACYSSC